MSRVFLSFDSSGGSTVAVKLLADHLAHSREFVGRFYREARLSRLLTHSNLVRGLGAGYDPISAKHYLILEFVDGPTTHTILGRVGRFPVGVVVQIGIDIARALEFLHSRQYVHRDVKPDNILLHPAGIAKLGDLGLAKRLNDDPHLTSTHLGVGTSYYMAYEQAVNADLVDGRSDLFALGATLYHLLTGEVPFPGTTHEEVIRVKENDTFRPVTELCPEVPEKLAEIIARMLARDPRARIQSAADLVAALEATGLAAPIPVYSPAEDLSAAPPEAPTRADIQIAPSPIDDARTDTPRDHPNGQVRSAPQHRIARWLPNRLGVIALAATLLSFGIATAAVFRPKPVPSSPVKTVTTEPHQASAPAIPRNPQ